MLWPHASRRTSCTACGLLGDPTREVQTMNDVLPSVERRRCSNQALFESRRCSSARDSARRSVMTFGSDSARDRITARSLSVVEEPAPARAAIRSS